ncbi:hormone-sensitive lipase [Lactarius indigo]|nr:hormone-sensitive lipase [Lactarius indigo]
MIDHIVGTPSPSWKRTQVFLVIFFWLWRITWGDARGPRILWIRALNRRLDDFTPWQIIVSTLTAVYAMRNADKLIGLGAPEPLARLYAPSYYRATWINTGLDAGFATAMHIRQKWLRDICSIIFSVYYIIFANEADEKLRKFRTAPTVEMLRVTWEKTSNPFLQLISHKKPVALYRKIILPRPHSSPYTRPITTCFNSSKDPLIALASERDLIFDVPGGGFISMGPEHHEERLRSWAVQTGKPVISLEYGKAPEYPYPFAIDEVFDAYRIIVESKGKAIGMAGEDLNIVLSGDSAGGCLATGCVVKIIEHNSLLSDSSLPYPAPTSRPSGPLPLPVAVMLSYPALDFNFTSWMTPSHLKVLREETEADELRQHLKSPLLMRRRSSSLFYSSDDDCASEGWAKELRGAKDHLSHVNPLSMVGQEQRSTSPVHKKSWRETFRMGLTSITGSSSITKRPKLRQSRSQLHLQSQETTTDSFGFTDSSSEEEEEEYEPEEHRPIEARIRYHSPASGGFTSPLDHAPNSRNTTNLRESHGQEVLDEEAQARLASEVRKANVEVAKMRRRAAYDRKNAPIGMRLTMTSRSGYFQDRIISPTMDYHISPILTPSHILAQFPPLLLQCGEKDPLVDDTIIFAGRVREAKRQRREELRGALAKGRGDLDSAELQKLEDELESLEVENDEDGLQMQIFSGWSHGYLQMPSLMPEAQVAIDDIATWIEGVFTTVSPVDSRAPLNVPSLETSTSEIEGTGSHFFSHLTNNSDTVRVRLDGDTVPHVRILAPGADDTASSLGCGTEADFENCVESIPKVRREPTMGGDPEKHTEDEATRREKMRKGIAAYNARSESGGVNGVGTFVRSPPRTPKKGFESVVGVIGGQIISESELMRRRRLLDSDIFVRE